MEVVMRVCHILPVGFLDHNTRDVWYQHDHRVENEGTYSLDLGDLAVDHSGYEQMDQSMVTPLLAQLMVAQNRKYC